MDTLTLTRQEFATIRDNADRFLERLYGIPVPIDAPPSIRTKILAERARRVGLRDVERCLLARVVDKPTPAHRAVETPKPTVESADAATARLLLTGL